MPEWLFGSETLHDQNYWLGKNRLEGRWGSRQQQWTVHIFFFFSSSFSFFLSFFLSVCFCCCKFLVGQMAVCWKGWEAPVVVGCQDVEDKSGLLSSTERSQWSFKCTEPFVTKFGVLVNHQWTELSDQVDHIIIPLPGGLYYNTATRWII